MSTFIVQGGKPLKGEITPQGAKDEALQVICATLLTSGKVTINNIPDTSDVNKLIELIDMGVRIILYDPNRATVIGQDKAIRLKGTVMSSPDIRAGVALLIAALSAEGKSVIHSIEQIDRDYQFIEKQINAPGADIQRLPG